MRSIPHQEKIKVIIITIFIIGESAYYLPKNY